MVNAKKIFICLFLIFVSVGIVFSSGKKDAKESVQTQEVPVDTIETVVVEEEVVEEPKAPETVAISISALNGPSGIPMAYMFENPPVIEGANVSFEISAGADVLLPKLLKGEVDIGILPPNVAAKVYTKNNGALVIGAVVGQGMIQVITRDKEIRTLADLKGKTVNVAGQGATPEYIFRYLLNKHGIEIAADGQEPTENTVALDFSIPAAELAPAIISKRIEYAVVPEPFVTVATSKDSAIVAAIDLQKEYRAVEAAEGLENYPMTVVVINSTFAKNHPEMVRQILAFYKDAIDWTNNNATKAGVLVQSHTLGLMAPIAAKVIPRGAYVYQSAQDARGDLEKLFEIFMSFSPEAVGGSLPDDGFYFN